MASNVLQMYRQILRAANHFPSSNKIGIIQEIKFAFHANRDCTDPALLQNHLQKAHIGLDELQSYLPENLMDETGHMRLKLRGNTLPEGQSTDDIRRP